MAKQRLMDYRLLTSTKVAAILGISRYQLKSWVKQGLLEPPTDTRYEKDKLIMYLFSHEWVEKNRQTVDQILGKGT